MSRNKKKIRKLTDEQYNLYIATLKNNSALYCADGKPFVPREIDERKDETARKRGD